MSAIEQQEKIWKRFEELHEELFEVMHIYKVNAQKTLTEEKSNVIHLSLKDRTVEELKTHLLDMSNAILYGNYDQALDAAGRARKYLGEIK